MNALLLLDTELFLEACEIEEFDDEERAQQAIAEFLAGDELVLEQAS
jgi:hypothetical protein